MKKKLLLTLTAMVCVLCCAFGLAACGDNDTPDNSGGNETVAIESIALNKSTLTLDIDGYETLTVTYTPTNATTKSVTWSSSAPTIASVDNTGKVTALTDGEATITATTANNKTASCVVTVNPSAPTYEVNAEQWVQIMNSANNYSYDIYKIDGEKVEFDSTEHQIIVKDGDNWYLYTEEDNSAGWSKMNLTTEQAAEWEVDQLFESIYLTKFLKENYSAFTYADGKYTADNLNINFVMDGTVKTAEVTFENGNLVGIKFSIEADGGATAQYEIKNVGTTNIKLPTIYTEVDN